MSKQTFKTQPDRVKALRGQFAALGINGFIVPLTDEHMSEYVGAYAGRLAWLTGFGGSAGSAAVLDDCAAIFIDGRYTIQVAQEVDPAVFSHQHTDSTTMQRWLASVVKPGMIIGYDPELATTDWVEATKTQLAARRASLKALDANPIDAVWTDRPAEPLAPASVHSAALAGESSADKCSRIAAELQDQGVEACVISALDSIAWTFNIRGSDVVHTPVVHSFATVRADGTATLFVHPDKVTDDVRSHLGNHVALRPRTDFYTALAELGGAGKRILFDASTNNAKIRQTLSATGAELVSGRDPAVLMKAVKNAAEVSGARSAHVRDGAAICDFLAWFDREAPKGHLTEQSAAAALWQARERTGCVKDSSFDTISGSGPNGAIVHYRVSDETNRRIDAGDVYLVDSGGQYTDGTTDITRTVSAGPIAAALADEVRDRFTRVLKGHIALATTRFPKGTSGMALDSIARKPLWDAGLDYAHGTGHGVGSYLAVHEGPQRIAKFGTSVPLEVGMILSNEPGYYRTGAYGIRIENLILVSEMGQTGDDQAMLGFETLTLAPIDHRMIDKSLLSSAELDWLNAYHARVRAALAPYVAPETKGWLESMTAAL